MKVLLALLILGAVVGLCVVVLRRGTRSAGYRRRFENAYRYDDAETTPVPGVMFVAGLGDPGVHHHSSGHDCGVSSDGGSPGCDGGN